MPKIFSKKNLSNLIFIIALVILIYPPSRVWFMRQIAFSPSIETISEREKLATYNWDLKGLNATSVNFKEFENKVVFVNFWATWCPPCRAEMPMIQNLVNDYKTKIDFMFVTNEDWSTVEKYFTKKGYNLPVYNSISAPPENFTKSNSIPASYIIDKEGNIVVSKIGAANWNSKKVRNLLDELSVK